MQSVGIFAHASSFQLPLLTSGLGSFHIRIKFAIRLCNIPAASLVNPAMWRKEQFIILCSVLQDVKVLQGSVKIYPWVTKICADKDI
jgi:hypothetical protein